MGRQDLPGTGLPQSAARGADAIAGRQMRLDRPDLDAIAAQLHLRIDAVQVFQVARFVSPYQVAGAVDPAELRADRELFGRQIGPLVVASRQSGPADAQFSALAIGQGAQR